MIKRELQGSVLSCGSGLGGGGRREAGGSGRDKHICGVVCSSSWQKLHMGYQLLGIRLVVGTGGYPHVRWGCE